jgi:hypothetical protein
MGGKGEGAISLARDRPFCPIFRRPGFGTRPQLLFTSGYPNPASMTRNVRTLPMRRSLLELISVPSGLPGRPSFPKAFSFLIASRAPFPRPSTELRPLSPLEDHSSVDLDTTLVLFWHKRVRGHYLLWKWPVSVEGVEMEVAEVGTTDAQPASIRKQAQASA